MICHVIVNIPAEQVRWGMVWVGPARLLRETQTMVVVDLQTVCGEEMSQKVMDLGDPPRNHLFWKRDIKGQAVLSELHLAEDKTSWFVFTFIIHGTWLYLFG